MTIPLAPQSGTGSSADIVTRVKALIPGRWFAWTAPYRDAILGGLADLSSWCYGFIWYARSQSRLATVYGVWLDIYAYDFLGRTLLRNGMPDGVFRALAKALILQERVTRNGMNQVVTTLTTNTPWIFEPWNTNDTGAYSSSRVGGPVYGQMGYGCGVGGWGSMNLPGQVFMKVKRAASSGIPNVGGYGSYPGGYGVGSVEYTGQYTPSQGITDAVIENAISRTKPTGTRVWMQFVTSLATPQPKPFPGFCDSNNSSYLAVI
jgi:hypothetical protein